MDYRILTTIEDHRGVFNPNAHARRRATRIASRAHGKRYSMMPGTPGEKAMQAVYESAVDRVATHNSRALSVFRREGLAWHIPSGCSGMTARAPHPAERG